MADDRVFDYLSGTLAPDERQAFETDLATNLVPAGPGGPSWRTTTAAARPAIKPFCALAQASRVRTSAWYRLWQWLWPAPASPLLPLGWALVIVMSVLVRQMPVQEPAMTRGTGDSRPRLIVDLPDTLTARQLRDTLAQYTGSRWWPAPMRMAVSF